jgi:hypothetical protein
MEPDGSSGEFVGKTPETGLIVRPPLIQFRQKMESTAGHAAEEAQSVFSLVARQLSIGQFFNLGIKHIYHAPVENNDARGFILHKLLSRSDGDFAELSGEPGRLWAGIRFGISVPTSDGDAVYDLRIEPLHAEQMRSLFIDLDASYPGAWEPSIISTRAGEAASYLTGAVNRYLDGL